MEKTTALGDALGADAARQFEAVFEAMTDGVWVCDSTPRLLWINRACERLNDICREDVSGQLVSDLLSRGNFDHASTTRVLQTGRPIAINQKVRSGRVLLVNAVPVFGDDGKIAYVVGTERDLTELNTLRGELERRTRISDRIHSELKALRMKNEQLSDVVAESEAMERVLETAMKAAGFDATVLLSGASGTGKTMVAKVIHECSTRADGPFMSLNCGAIPEALLEAEVFGYGGGAFTDAKKTGKPGLIEAAAGGTLFLDEIDGFPLALQVKLLTFLDTKSFIRVGETEVQTVDVRIIAATNRDLSELVKNGEFREDLLFRLNIVPIAIPPLRDRRADIPRLVQSYLARLNQRYQTSRRLAPEVMDVLCRSDFPGNVRELQNTLERAFVLTEADEITMDALPAEARGSARTQTAPKGQLSEILNRIEAQVVAEACQRHKRQVDIAAELGVSQATVARLLRKHRLKTGQSEFIQA
jgi:PAS domain S-box-containing protein